MKIRLIDLPDDVRAAIAPYIVESASTLASIGVAIARLRDDAIAARKSSGIETTWKECEEAYVGIDDANRHEFQDAKWSKPMSMDGPVTTGKEPKQTDHKSTAFVRLTARYVDAGSAKLAEILLPADDKAFSFSETPLPELVKAKEDKSQVVSETLGVPLTRPARPGEAVPGATPAPMAAPAAGGAVPGPGAAGGLAALTGGAPGAPAAPAPPPEMPLTVADLAEEKIEFARKAAKLAETRIYDWMVECQRTAEMRKVIEDAARIGVGVLKGPVPVHKKAIAVEKDESGKSKVIVKNKINPASKWCDPWNIFPDPACGENIHNGDFIFDRDFMSGRQVRDLKKVPGYIAAQIDRVLEEGPEGPNKDDDGGSAGSSNASKTKGRYTIWYYYGSIKREELGVIWNAAAQDLKYLPADKKEVYAIVTMINECVVKATINPLDSGEFPYHSVPWSRRAGHWAGIGVGEQVRMPQKTVNSATRAMLNNAGKAAGAQVVIDFSAVRPADKEWTLTPDKIWYKIAGEGSNNVAEAFKIYQIECVTPQLMTIIQYGMQLAEESSSIPLITQGQSGDTQPETLGATNIQNNNANQLLRSIGYAFDDHITEPEVRQYYEWLLLDDDVPDEEKGDFTINAHGSVALVEQAIQDQTIAQMGPLVLNPAYGINPKKWANLFIKTKRLDPEDLQYSEEEQKKIDAAPPPEAPAVAAARIRADVDTKKMAATKDTDDKAIQADEHRSLITHVEVLHEIQTRRELALLDYANTHKMKLEDVKARLADTALKLEAEERMHDASTSADLHKHHNPAPMPPPVQLPGRAANGHAFDQSTAK